MKIFYYQIKGASKDEHGGFYWAWPPIWTDIIHADDKKDAINLLELEHSKKLPQRVLRKNIDLGKCMINIHEIKEGDYTYKKLLSVNICEQCGQDFTMLEKYQIHDGFYRHDFCSLDCLKKSKPFSEDTGDGYHAPTIYKITNRKTNKCYIGQTTQAFTLRWYQHFFQSGSSSAKFHEAVNNSNISEWTFEVLEIIERSGTTGEMKKLISEREQHFIERYNSIESGYNSVVAISGVPN